MKGKFITLPQDGKQKEFFIMFGFKAFRKFKDLTGKSVMNLDTDNFDESDIPKLIFSAIKADLSVDEIVEMIDESDYSMAELNETLMKAILLSTTGKEEIEEKNALRAEVLK